MRLCNFKFLSNFSPMCFDEDTMTYCHGTWNEILNFERFVECMHFELNMQLLICAPLAMCHVELPWCMNQHYAILWKCVVCISQKLRFGSFKIHFSHMKSNYVPMSINLFILIFFCRIHLETKAINVTSLLCTFYCVVFPTYIIT